MQRYSDNGIVSQTPFKPIIDGKVKIIIDLKIMDRLNAIIAEYLPLFKEVKKLEPRILNPLTKKVKLKIVNAFAVMVISSILSLEEIKKFKEINHVDVAVETLKLQKEQFENKITKMQAVAKNLESIIEKIEETRERYETSENLIDVKNCDPIYGVIGECKTVNDWYQFEAKLLELTERYPNYSQVGHNHGLYFIYDEKYLDYTKKEDLQKILMPIDEQFIHDLNVNEYSLGKCIVAYHKGEVFNIKDTFTKIKEYISKKELQIRGDIIITSIISPFIVNNDNEHLTEIKIPIFDDKVMDINGV